MEDNLVLRGAKPEPEVTDVLDLLCKAEGRLLAGAAQSHEDDVVDAEDLRCRAEEAMQVVMPEVDEGFRAVFFHDMVHAVLVLTRLFQLRRIRGLAVPPASHRVALLAAAAVHQEVLEPEHSVFLPGSSVRVAVRKGRAADMPRGNAENVLWRGLQEGFAQMLRHVQAHLCPSDIHLCGHQFRHNVRAGRVDLERVGVPADVGVVQLRLPCDVQGLRGPDGSEGNGDKGRLGGKHTHRA
mmetsp:Transcript_10980/g.29028  ORF Transcript_10980/g.29028 Transcript_10980/m.29028 type:complete len:239 (-) Transcript_10980:60-776(-)